MAEHPTPDHSAPDQDHSAHEYYGDRVVATNYGVMSLGDNSVVIGDHLYATDDDGACPGGPRAWRGVEVQAGREAAQQAARAERDAARAEQEAARQVRQVAREVRQAAQDAARAEREAARQARHARQARRDRDRDQAGDGSIVFGHYVDGVLHIDGYVPPPCRDEDTDTDA